MRKNWKDTGMAADESQTRTRRRKNCGKVEADVKNLVTKTEASSSTVLSPNASNRSGILRAPSQQGLILQESTGKPVARDSTQNDAASSSQVWQKMQNEPRSSKLSWKFREYEETRSVHGGENSESIDGNDTVWPHNLHISTAYVPHLEKVFENVRQKFGRKPGDKKWKISM